MDDEVLDPETEAMLWRATEKLETLVKDSPGAHATLVDLVQEAAPGDIAAQATLIDQMLVEGEA